MARLMSRVPKIGCVILNIGRFKHVSACVLSGRTARLRSCEEFQVRARHSVFGINLALRSVPHYLFAFKPDPVNPQRPGTAKARSTVFLSSSNSLWPRVSVFGQRQLRLPA